MSAMGSRSIAGLALAGLLLAAGCGTESSPGAAPATTQPPTTTAATTTTIDAKKVSTEVTTSFQTFFEHFKGDPALLEDGEAMKAGIISLGKSAQAPGVTVTVKEVKPMDDAACDAAAVTAPCAAVKFDLNLNGDPVLPDQNGFAVNQGGTWKVAKPTFCTLAGLGGSTPEGC